MSSSGRYIRDDWPKMPDNTDYDGKELLALLRGGKSPFTWDVNLLIREIEDGVAMEVADIPFVSKGSNNYGFHLEMSDGQHLLARLARGDVNMRCYDGADIDYLLQEHEFEVNTYALLRQLEPSIPTSRVLYHRAPTQYAVPGVDVSADISGRNLMVFEKEEGENNIWRQISFESKASLLSQAARIRASLFDCQLPPGFTKDWLLSRTFGFMPKELPLQIAPTREFWVAMFTSKINATIREEGDPIGWEDDNNIVGPVAAKAKQSILRFIPHMLPTGSADDEASLYRLVLDHGDFGIHNMSITVDSAGKPSITSLFDWETGHIVPTILTNPEMAVPVDLITNEEGAPSITRTDRLPPEEVEEYMGHASQYIKALYECTPFFERAIRAGRDARHLWFALKHWRGDDPEGYFGELGIWAERRLKEIGRTEAV